MSKHRHHHKPTSTKHYTIVDINQYLNITNSQGDPTTQVIAMDTIELSPTPYQLYL